MEKPYIVSAMNCDIYAINISDFIVDELLSTGIIYESECAYSFLPQSATIKEIYRSNQSGIVYIDYMIGSVHHIDEYYSDGTVKYNVFEENENRGSNHYSMDEETMKSIKAAVACNGSLECIENIKVNEINGRTFIYPQNMILTNANVKVVNAYSEQEAREYYPVLCDVNDFFNSYNAEQVDYANRYISELGAFRSVYVYETQDYYTTVSADYESFVIGTTFSAIANAISWPVSAIEYALLAVDVLFSAETLLEDIIFYYNSDIEYWFAIEGGIYDSTYENAIVQVALEQEWGTFNYGLNSNNIPVWIRSGNDIPYPFINYTLENNYDPIIENVVEIYNNNIEAYGYWKWGTGIFGG